MGSLTTALASWLDARAIGGQWYVRIEDIDQPRETPGATQEILKQLIAHRLQWLHFFDFIHQIKLRG